MQAQVEGVRDGDSHAERRVPTRPGERDASRDGGEELEQVQGHRDAHGEAHDGAQHDGGEELESAGESERRDALQARLVLGPRRDEATTRRRQL